MEKNVVTLETARKLWQAGFKLPYTLFYYSSEGIDDHYRLFYNSMEYENSLDDVLAPTAQEIANQLPKRVAWLLNNVNLVTYYPESTLSEARYIEASTMAEALAALWLKLQLQQ